MNGRQRIVIKGWGREIIWAEEDGYCGKILEFDRIGSCFSTHFHVIKDETWLVLEGSFRLEWIDTSTAEHHRMRLEVDDIWRNPPLCPHRLIALSVGAKIIEVSTRDDPGDNYRIAGGDSQLAEDRRPKFAGM